MNLNSQKEPYRKSGACSIQPVFAADHSFSFDCLDLQTRLSILLGKIAQDSCTRIENIKNLLTYKVLI